MPIFVGELQNVVPVGDFLRMKLLTKNRTEISSLEPYSKFIKDLRHVLDRKKLREKTLRYFGVVNSWKQRELLKDYPLKDAQCGWTFFRDQEWGSMTTSFQNHHLVAVIGNLETQGLTRRWARR